MHPNNREIILDIRPPHDKEGKFNRDKQILASLFFYMKPTITKTGRYKIPQIYF